MRAISLLTLILLLGGGTVGLAQEPQKPVAPQKTAPGAARAAAGEPAPARDPLELPFVRAAGPKELFEWVKHVKLAMRGALRQARLRRDAVAVSRLLVRLEWARAHAYRELARLKTEEDRKTRAR